jgi:hypothetical protein
VKPSIVFFGEPLPQRFFTLKVRPFFPGWWPTGMEFGPEFGQQRLANQSLAKVLGDWDEVLPSFSRSDQSSYGVGVWA